MALTKLQTGAITDKAVTSGKMSDGTDGQLITWDTSAVADTVATGGTTQVSHKYMVLGAKPTFQDTRR